MTAPRRWRAGALLVALAACAKEEVPRPPRPARFAVRGGIGTLATPPDGTERFQVTGGGVAAAAALCNGRYCVQGGIRPWTEEEARSR